MIVEETTTPFVSPADASIETRRANLCHAFADAWLDYPRAQQILETLNALLKHPKVERMPNLAIIGKTNNGKSTLLTHFVGMHTKTDVPTEEATHLPILRISTPAQPDEWRLYDNVLRALFSHGPRREHVESQIDRIALLFDRLDTRMLVLDEFSNALAGSGNRQKAFLNGLKNLGNRLRVPIVIAGVPECLAALASDPQLTNRFKPMDLPVWENLDLCAGLFQGMESSLGLLESCDFTNKKTLRRIIHASEGLIGEMVDLLCRLAQRAIGSKEIIDPDDLTPEALKAIGWIRPSDRPRYAAGI